MGIMMTETMSVAAPNDAELVSESLTGNRDAFGQIVARYQSLICSLAYSATGSLSQSEDLAQDTFVAAWKQLGNLREPPKLRSWLCQIARNLASDTLKKQGREPSHRAESLEEIAGSHSPEPLPIEQTISNEEQAILWRSLERIPELYREPLVLFYREHQSIESVAQNLELTEDAVKQRLSRGRKMLHEQVLAFVEGALEKTSPGKNFTLAVIAALPLATASAKAATIGAALAKGGTAAKGVMTVGTIGSFFAMLGGAYISFMAHANDSKSPRERQFILENFGKRLCFTVLMLAGLIAASRLDFFRVPLHLCYSIAAIGFFTAVYSSIMLPRITRRRQQIQIEDGTFDPTEWTMPRKLTEVAADAPNGKAKNRTRALKFMAFGFAMLLFIVLQESWKLNFGHAILITCLMVLALLRGFLRWRSQPRFLSPRSFVIGFPVFMGLMILFFFDWHQYLAHLGADSSRIVSLGEILVFNLVVAMAYAALVGILVWKRHAEFRSMPLK